MLLILLLFVTIRALAGPLASCTKAASSGSGNYLVVAQAEIRTGRVKYGENGATSHIGGLAR